MIRSVALLRGINVGGHNKLPMKSLVALVEAAGATDVTTYIQSGNVALTAPAGLLATLPVTLAAAIQEAHGIAVPVVLRTAAELADTVTANPYLAAGTDPDQLHVAFLAAVPPPARVAALDPRRSRGDAFTVIGRDVFLHLPNGVAKTRLTNAWLDGQLATTSTLRNWRTVLKLLAMAAAP